MNSPNNRYDRLSKAGLSPELGLLLGLTEDVIVIIMVSTLEAAAARG
jgi:hypothetical protein